MKKVMNKKGFTLVEILVAALIMIILVTMAVPMYERAIEKSRVAEVSITLKRLGEAKLRWMDQQNKSSFSLSDISIYKPWDQLDVEKPSSADFSYGLYPANFPISVCAKRAKGPNEGTTFLYVNEDQCDCTSSHASGTICYQYCTESTKLFCGGTPCEDYGMDNWGTSVGECQGFN